MTRSKGVEMAKGKEGVELLSDGRVKLVVDGNAVVLRRPKIGEMRTLVEAIQSLPAAPEEGARSFMAGAEDIADWWRNVVATLSDGTLPEDIDDLPVWLLAGELLGSVITHWREVPYLSGG
jgi:hypothetical protein